MALHKLLEALLIWFSYLLYTFPAYAILIIVFVKYYENIKKISGDALSAFGFLGKFVRKTSITCKIEGSLNLFAKSINAELNGLILPKVKVEFANANNIQAFISNNQPIIRMNFSKNRNENLVNASIYYVRTALIYKSKPYIEKELVTALDFHMARKILVEHKTGDAITYFDDHYLLPEFEKKGTSKDYYAQLQQIDDAGFLTRVLLKEYKDFGDKIFPASPADEHVKESKDFLSFVYTLATRVKDEKTELAFCGNHIRIGIILVSKWETYERYGIIPYLRRIKLLAKDNINTVYFFASGDKHIEILKEIRTNLLKNESFTEISLKKYRYKNKIAVCALFRLDYENMITQTENMLTNAKENNSVVDAVVTNVQQSFVLVDVDGIAAKIPLEEASSKRISDARLYFHNDGELKVKVITSDDLMNVIVSNKGTETDPVELIEKEYSVDKILKAKIKKIKDYGLIVNLDNGMQGFIPYSNATFGRFQKLDTIFKIDDELEVKPINFDANYKNIVLSIFNREDPWCTIDNTYKVGDIIEAKVCAIEEKRIICELKPGIEGIIWQNELDWLNPDVNSLGIQVGMTVKAKIKNINSDRKIIALSRRDALTNPLAKLYEDSKNIAIKGVVTSVRDKVGVELKFANGIKGFVHISEVDWSYIEDLKKYCPIGSEIQVKLLSIDTIKNHIWASRKALIPNPIEEFKKYYKEESIIKGIVERVEDWGALIKIDDRFPKIKGIITKGELTNLFFVTDVRNLLKQGKEYRFSIISIDMNSQRVVLSRKKMFEKTFDSLTIKYGESYNVYIIGKNKSGEPIVENDDKFQGVLISSGNQRISIGSFIDISIAGINKASKLIEVHC